MSRDSVECTWTDRGKMFTRHTRLHLGKMSPSFHFSLDYAQLVNLLMMIQNTLFLSHMFRWSQFVQWDETDSGIFMLAVESSCDTYIPLALLSHPCWICEHDKSQLGVLWWRPHCLASEICQRGGAGTAWVSHVTLRKIVMPDVKEHVRAVMWLTPPTWLCRKRGCVTDSWLLHWSSV